MRGMGISSPFFHFLGADSLERPKGALPKEGAFEPMQALSHRVSSTLSINEMKKVA